MEEERASQAESSSYHLRLGYRSVLSSLLANRGRFCCSTQQASSTNPTIFCTYADGLLLTPHGLPMDSPWTPYGLLGECTPVYSGVHSRSTPALRECTPGVPLHSRSALPEYRGTPGVHSPESGEYLPVNKK